MSPSSVPDGLPQPARTWSALTIWLALTMAVLDGAIANVALPTIAADFGAAPADAIWVVNAYQLTIVVSLLPLAALGAMVTYRRVFLCGVVAFTIASLACATVHSLTALIVMRALQGFGAAGIMSVNGALLRHSYPQAALGRGIGLNTLVISVTAAIAPTVTSGILLLGPWEWLFAINVPIGLVTLLLGRAALPQSVKTGHLDLRSTVLNMLTFGLLFTGTDMLTRGGTPWIGAVELVAAVVTGALLVSRSRRQPWPLVPIDLLRSRLFSLSVATSIGSFTAQMLTFVALPFLLQGLLHRTVVETGLLMTPWPCGVGIAAPIAGRLSDRLPAAILGGFGLILLASGLALLAMLPADASGFDVCWRMAICGVGFGSFQAPNNRVLLSSAPVSRAGAAGGMLATARLAGQTTGATLAAICFHAMEATPAETLALALASGFAAVAAVASLSRLAAAPVSAGGIGSRSP